MKQTQFGLGLIGAGGRGRITWQAHRPAEGFVIKAACALTLEEIADIHAEVSPEIKLSTDYREVLANPEVDIVFICTPDFLHREHALAAIHAGRHVFLEKPMGITIDECDLILNAAQARGVILYVGHNMRFFPVFRKMKELITSGAIGELQAIWCRHFVSYGGDAYFKDWHSERKNVSGLLLQKGAHDIDVMHWLAGSYTERVVGMGKLSVYDKLPRKTDARPAKVEIDVKNYPPGKTKGYSPVIDVEDHNMVLLQMRNGVQGCYAQCHYAPDDVRNYTVIGTEGRIENYGDMPLPGKPASIHLWNQRTGYEPFGHQSFLLPEMEGTHGGADPLLINDFLRVLQGHAAEGASPQDARMAVAAGYLATKSLHEGNACFTL